MIIDWDIQIPAFQAPPFGMVAACCEQVEGINKPIVVHVQITDDVSIHQINQIFRQVDASTDVLSFPTIQYPKGKHLADCIDLLKPEYDPDFSAYMLGDIVISLEHAKAQAKEYEHSLERELCYLFTHAIFHLMGYDHMQDNEKALMRKHEEMALQLAGITRENKETSFDEARLIELARKALQNSYVPYSHYAVGAALHTKDGRIFLGCNVENASYGLTNCAERTAIFKAVSEGSKEFDAIAIASSGSLPYPCGSCRQVLAEFSPDIRILISGADHKILKTTLQELLPHSFGPKSLSETETSIL